VPDLAGFGESLLSRGRTLLDGAADLERELKQLRGLDIGELRVDLRGQRAAAHAGGGACGQRLEPKRWMKGAAPTRAAVRARRFRAPAFSNGVKREFAAHV